MYIGNGKQFFGKKRVYITCFTQKPV